MRISALSTIARCPGLRMLQAAHDSESQASHSGSAVGRVLELCHRGWVIDEALRHAQAQEDYALADWSAVSRWAIPYCADPRNGGGVVLGDMCEREVNVSLPPPPEFPGEPIHLKGHVDQIRRGNDGVLRVWDLKSGKDRGIDLLHTHAWQLAGYAVAATETLGETVLPGGIIRLRGYVWSTRCKWKREALHTAPVFFHAPWSLPQCHVMLESAVYLIAMLREGLVLTTPGVHCGYCPAAGPHVCTDQIGEDDDSRN